MEKLTLAICTFNRASRLDPLIASARAQKCPIPFDILVVDNNSSDNTQTVLEDLAQLDGPVLRYVKEMEQGIPYARNKAISSCLDSTYMVFIDDDEIPQQGLLSAAVDALKNEGAECVGGAVQIMFPDNNRPHWLGDELLGFLAEIDHGPEAFWITDASTPVWTANVGYRMSIFRNNPDLRFDHRYNRLGKAIGGGSDAVMFRNLLDRNIKLRYRPDMIVEHYVEEWRLKRSYFLKLHFIAGRKYGQYQAEDYTRTLFGVPFFFLNQAIGHWLKALRMFILRKPAVLRQAMNGSYAVGMMWGKFKKYMSE